MISLKVLRIMKKISKRKIVLGETGKREELALK